MSTTNKLKLLTQIVFLCFFIFLLVIGWIQLWMALVLGCIIAALILGRFYCGWICPTNTIMIPFDYLRKKLRIQRRIVPKFLQSEFIRYTIFALFIVILLLTLIKGIKMPVLPILTLAAVLLTLFFPAALWHRHLCPFGVLLSVTGSVAKLGFRVNLDRCSGCGICQRHCDGNAIQIRNKGNKAVILSSYCLQCNECADKCPQDAIGYTSRPSKSPKQDVYKS